MSLNEPNMEDDYAPDRRLTHTYDEANLLDEAGLEALCPSYIELSEVSSRYEVDKLLGQGALKDVYRTYDGRAKRWVAMARLRENRGPEFYDLFVHEAWLTSSLSHPNIIKIYDVGVDGDGYPFFTMDLKGNTSLEDLVGGEGETGRRELLNIFTKVCDAVAYAHSRGVIHLDLKPENIQTDDFGETLVCDWGLGKVMGAAEEKENDIPTVLQSLDNMTLVGQIKGTPGYMAPEQVIPGSQKDFQTDIFSLGCILHTILTGLPPFLGSRATVIDATTRANIVPPRMRYPKKNIPESLEAVVMKATARLPEDRYGSVLELKTEVASFLRGYATSAERPGFFREISLFISRNRVPASITCLSLILITVLSVLFVQRLNRQMDVIQEEKLRGAQWESEAGSIKTEYDSMRKESKESRQETAANMMKSVRNLNNLGFFDRPLETIRQVRELCKQALVLDPRCEEARYQLFLINCIELNFKQIITWPPTKGMRTKEREKMIQVRMDFAEEYPGFNFSRGYRPTIDQLVDFMEWAEPMSYSMPLMERILCYDHAARKNKTSYDKVVCAFLEYYNHGKENVIFKYNPKDQSVFLWSDKDLRLVLNRGPGPKLCVLQLLPCWSLKLDVDGKFLLSDLEGLSIQALDISECKNVVLDKPVSMSMLTNVITRKGQFDPLKLKRFIKTTDLTVIEKMK